MRAFRVTLEIRTQKSVTIAAADDQAASKAALRVHGPAARVVQVALDVTPGASSGQAVLRHILAAPFLPLAGQNACLRDWVLAARQALADGRDVAPLNRQLAMAGLRLDDNRRLAIGSPGSIPTLGDILEDSPYANEEILTALARIPGSAKSVRTFLGICSRSVTLPWGEVQAVLA